MALLPALLTLLQTAAEPIPQPANPQRETVIVAPAPEGEKQPPIRSRIGREQPALQAADPLAAMVLREWANCIVRTRRRDALALLATPVNSEAQTAAIEDLTSRRFGWQSICVRTRMMRVDNIVLRGAVAEALHRWEKHRRRSAGPLAAAPPPAPVGRPAQLVLAGHCVVEADPAAVAAVMETRPGTNGSLDALEALAPQLNACLPEGMEASDFHPLMLRGLLGEPFYLNSRSL